MGLLGGTATVNVAKANIGERRAGSGGKAPTLTLSLLDFSSGESRLVPLLPQVQRGDDDQSGPPQLGLALAPVRISDIQALLPLVQAQERQYATEMADSRRAGYLATSLALRLLIAEAFGINSCRIHSMPRTQSSRTIYIDGRETMIGRSISYSTEIAAVAISVHQRIGIDIECEPRLAPSQWKYFMGERERSAAAGDAAFAVKCWLLKEAFIKVSGKPWSTHVKSLDVVPDHECDHDQFIVSSIADRCRGRCISLPHPLKLGLHCWIGVAWA